MYRNEVAGFMLFLVSSCFGVGIGQQVTFEIVDSEFNEVVFVGESNITIRCSVVEFTGDIEIRIESPTGSTLAGETRTYTVENSVKRAEAQDNGVYRCIVEFVCSDGSRETLEKSLILNVQNSDEPRCFRNGTIGMPFLSGETLRLSCYCELNDECKWISTVVDTRVGVTEVSKSVIYRGKLILRLVKQYTAPTQTRYDCIRFSRGPVVELHQCSIGPADESTGDAVINTEDVYTQLKSQVCAIPATSETMQFTDGLPSPGQGDHLVFVIIGSISIIILLALTIVFIIFCRRRHAHTETKSNEDVDDGPQNGVFTRDDEQYSSPYYSGTDEHDTSFAKVNNNSVEPEITNKDNALGHTYDDPPTARSRNDRPVVIADGNVDETQTEEDYAEINERRSYRHGSVGDVNDSQSDGPTLQSVELPHAGPVSTKDNIYQDTSDVDDELPSSGFTGTPENRASDSSPRVRTNSASSMLYAEVDKDTSNIADSVQDVGSVGAASDEDLSGGEGRSAIAEDDAAVQNAALGELYSAVDKTRKSNSNVSQDDSPDHKSEHVGQSESEVAGEDTSNRGGVTEDPVDFGMLYAKVDKPRGTRRNESSGGEHDDDVSELYARIDETIENPTSAQAEG